jgi:hypothetical protein
MDLENITLNERNQPQKITYRRIPLKWNVHPDTNMIGGCLEFGEPELWEEGEGLLVCVLGDGEIISWWPYNSVHN